MKKAITTSLTLISIAFGSIANAEQSQIDAIENAAMTLNTTELVALTQSAQQYDLALAYYRLAISQNLSADANSAIDSLDQGIEVLETHLELQTEDGEAWALLAQMYGLKVAYEPMKGVFYGPKSGSALTKAFTFAPNSPRTHLVKGVSSYNTPSIFGGSKTAALKALDKSISLFANDSSDNQWGHAEAYIWRGLTQMAQNNSEQAINDWQQALAIAPQYGWAKMLIAQNQ